MIVRLAKARRERAIGAAYRRGYAKYPQEERIGQLGLALLAEFDRAEGGTQL